MKLYAQSTRSFSAQSPQNNLVRRKQRFHRRTVKKMSSIAGCLKQKIYGKIYSSWEHRYCVLDKDIDDNKLWIYKDQEHHFNKLKPIEIIFIKNIEPGSIQIHKSNDKQFSFWIQNDKRSQYFLFEAVSYLQCTTWVEKLIMNQQSKKRKSIHGLRQIAKLKKRSAEVTISALSADSELYRGWCESELARKKYQKRFFVLTSIDLRYWKNNSEYGSNKPPKVCIPLHLISDIQHIDTNTLRIYVHYQDEENDQYKLRLFEFYSKDEEDISNFASGMSKSNWRRQELRGRQDLEATIIRRLESPKIFSSPKQNKEYKAKQPSMELLQKQRTTYFRVNAPMIDEEIDEEIRDDDEFDEDEENDIELDECKGIDPYRRLSELWVTDFAEKRKSILKTSSDNKPQTLIRKKVEFISTTKVSTQYDASSEESDASLSDSSDQMKSVHPTFCGLVCSCLLRCCRSNFKYDAQLE